MCVALTKSLVLAGRVNLTKRPHRVSRRQVINCNQYSIFIFILAMFTQRMQRQLQWEYDPTFY